MFLSYLQQEHHGNLCEEIAPGIHDRSNLFKKGSTVQELNFIFCLF